MAKEKTDITSKECVVGREVETRGQVKVFAMFEWGYPHWQDFMGSLLDLKWP